MRGWTVYEVSQRLYSIRIGRGFCFHQVDEVSLRITSREIPPWRPWGLLRLLLRDGQLFNDEHRESAWKWLYLRQATSSISTKIPTPLHTVSQTLSWMLVLAQVDLLSFWTHLYGKCRMPQILWLFLFDELGLRSLLIYHQKHSTRLRFSELSTTLPTGAGLVSPEFTYVSGVPPWQGVSIPTSLARNGGFRLPGKNVGPSWYSPGLDRQTLFFFSPRPSFSWYSRYWQHPFC